MQALKDVCRHPVIFVRGAAEFRSGMGMTWDDDESKNEAYDWGRETVHRLTFRRFES